MRTLLSLALLLSLVGGASGQINPINTYNANVDGSPNTGMFISVTDGTFAFTQDAAPEADPAFAAFTHLLTFDGFVFAQAGYGIYTDGFNVSQFGEGDPIFQVDSTSDFALLGDTSGAYSFLGLANDLGETTGYLRYIFGPEGVRVNGFAYLEPALVGTGVPVTATLPGGGGGNAALRQAQQRSQRAAAERARRK